MDNLYKWYALYTMPRAEKKVLDSLLQRRIEAYLPMRKELKQWSDRKKWVETPIIHSYIFVRIQKPDYLRVFEVKGVVRYVSVHGKVVVIPDHEMEAMKRAVDSNLSFNVEPSSIRKGQIITIASGPLKGITGEVEEVRGTKKLYLRISNLGYSLVVTLDDEVKKD
jgi:transcription antitermination factor NusG